MATVDYTIDYSDERFTDIESDKEEALANVNNTYNSMISESDQYYQDQIDAVKDYAETQAENQQAQTDLAIEEINQQKEQAEKDYTKEQTASYVDWQKESNKYGVNAETMAASGLSNSGYSESSQVSMYNTYQNRVATARESYNQAVLSYDNAIEEARLANNSALAEIAYNALQTQLELSLEGFQYKNTLLLQQLQAQQDIDDTYYQRTQDLLSQINTENALAEQVREYESTLAWEKEQAEQEQANWEKEYALAQAELKASTSSSGSASVTSGSASVTSGSASVTSSSSGSTSTSSSTTDALGTTYSSSDKNIASSNNWTSNSVCVGGSSITKSATQYGTFSNGYQPKGITGYGTLSKSGQYITVNGKKQNIWTTTTNGVTRAWYWDGSSKTYVGIS